MIRTRDTSRGYGSRQRAPAFLQTTAWGTGHITGQNKRFCASCADDRPSKGGHMRGPLFICSLHQKASVPA